MALWPAKFGPRACRCDESSKVTNLLPLAESQSRSVCMYGGARVSPSEVPRDLTRHPVFTQEQNGKAKSYPPNMTLLSSWWPKPDSKPSSQPDHLSAWRETHSPQEIELMFASESRSRYGFLESRNSSIYVMYFDRGVV